MACKLEKNLIFYCPEKPGELFCLDAGSTVNYQVVDRIVAQLEKKTETSVACILERREVHRSIGR